MRHTKGFTMLELLIVIGVLGVVLGIGFINGREALRTQQERAAINTVQQSIWQAATNAAATGRTTRLMRSGRELTIVNSDNDILRRFELPENTNTTLPEEEILEFSAPGKITQESYENLKELKASRGLTIEANDKTYDLTVSLIGEVKTEVRE